MNEDTTSLSFLMKVNPRRGFHHRGCKLNLHVNDMEPSYSSLENGSKIK